MLYFLFGQDTFRSRAKLAAIKERFLKEKSIVSLRHLDCSTISFRDIQEELWAQSLFQEKKLLVLEHALQNKELAEKLEENKNLLQDAFHIVIFFEQGDCPRNEFAKFLMQKATVQEFGMLTGAKLKSWIAQEFKRYNTPVTSEAVEFLVQAIGSDLWQMSQRVQQLVAFQGKEQVTQSNVAVFVQTKKDTHIFTTIEAVAKKDKKQALALLQEHIAQGAAPLYLLSMMAFQFRTLLEIKDLADKNMSPSRIATKAKLHPFVVQKGYRLSQGFTMQELVEVYGKLADIDKKAKTGRVIPVQALFSFVAELPESIRV
jgi:DNA polymerase III subunit delta